MPTVGLYVSAQSDVASEEQQDTYYADVANTSYIPPVYALDTYSITVSASLEFDEGEIESNYEVSDVRITSNTEFFAYNDNGDSVTIQTGTSTPFEDYYEFIATPPGDLPEDLPNANVEIVDYDDAIDDGFVTLVKWNEPDPDTILVSHVFEVDVTYIPSNTVSTSTKTMYHTMYYDYRLMIDKIEELADLGVY